MTILGVLALVVLVLAGIPIYLAIFVSGMMLLVWGADFEPLLTMQIMFGRLNSTSLLAVPLFILLGQILAVGGAGKPLIRVMTAFMGHIPGGPAYAIIVGNILLAAMCASPIAGIAAFGPVMVPVMRGLGYSERFTYGLVICSAVLSPIIPPAILPIIYAIIATSAIEGGSVSVLTLWTASIIPGVVIALLLGITVYIHSRRGHFQQLPPASWSERWQALKEGWAILIMPGVVLGPIYAGKATPTESAAIGMVYVLLISIFIYRGLNLKNFWEATASTARVIGMVFAIMGGALLLTVALPATDIPYKMADWLADLGLPWYGFMVTNVILFTFLGMFMDPAAIILISVPILMETVLNVGIDPVVYGVFVCLAVNLANITPPYGMLIFGTMGILNKPYEFVVRACLMFIPAIFVGMIMVGFWPGLSTWLPTVTGR